MISLQRYREILFDSNDYVCAGYSAFDTGLISAEALHPKYEYVAINPFKKGSSRLDVNVSKFRNILIEIDTLPVDQQRAYIDSLKIPYSTIVYSGGKSLHFIISLAEPLATKAEYDALVSRVMKAVPKADSKARNCGRFTRNPLHFRADKQKSQELVYTGDRVENKTLLEALGALGVAEVAPRPKREKAIKTGLKGVLNPTSRNFLMMGAAAGDWNNSLFLAACDAFRAQYTIDEFVSLAIRITGVLDHQDHTTIRSAYRSVMQE